MATLIAVYNSDGCVGRCDAKCYNAKVEGCDCVCGGANHGVGLAKAQDNTREHFRQWIDTYIEAKGLEGAKGRVSPKITQLELPL
jgi:hypothetical protein